MSARTAARLVGAVLLVVGIVCVATLIDCAVADLGQDQCYDDRRSLAGRGGMAVFGGLFLLSYAWIEDRRARDRQRDLK